MKTCNLEFPTVYNFKENMQYIDIRIEHIFAFINLNLSQFPPSAEKVAGLLCGLQLFLYFANCRTTTKNKHRAVSQQVEYINKA